MYVSFCTAPKSHLGHCNVGNIAADVRSALAVDRFGFFVQYAKDYRDIVWSEAPENVFFSSEFSNVQSVGIDVVDSPEFP